MTREKGHYWFKPAPSEPWEPAEWDADNQCWWVCASETPWDEQQVSTIVIGPKIEPPPAPDVLTAGRKLLDAARNSNCDSAACDAFAAAMDGT